jgi:hypothetical protein
MQLLPHVVQELLWIEVIGLLRREDSVRHALYGIQSPPTLTFSIGIEPLKKAHPRDGTGARNREPGGCPPGSRFQP